MTSQSYEIKIQAIKLRRQAYSLGMIEKALGVSKSTLSGWLKDIILNSKQKKKLNVIRLEGLTRARKEAVKWHNKQKELRLAEAKKQALHTLSKINFSEQSILDLALAMLYLGEGFKTKQQTGIGNSSPLILKFFIKALKLVYNLDTQKIKCYLHLRADQNPFVIKKYWSKELNIPIKNFVGVAIDARTKGSKTYDHYKGVCVLECSNVAIQRKLLFLAQEFCEKIISF